MDKQEDCDNAGIQITLTRGLWQWWNSNNNHKSTSKKPKTLDKSGHSEMHTFNQSIYLFSI